MRDYSKLFKRVQAMVLSVAIMLSVANFGLWVGVSALEATETKTDGQIVAENYDITAAEKALLASGLLAGKTYTYTVPDADDDLISVDIDNKTITAESYKDGGYVWQPATAVITVGEDTKETVTLTDGKGAYKYDGSAFSVKVTYELKTTVDENTQKDLLGAPAALKQGIANLDAISEQAGNLYILEQAMPELVKFANDGIETPLASFSFSDDCKTAVNLLNAQMTANGGKLDLSVIADEYSTASSKSGYLFDKGADAKAKAELLYNNLSTINKALNTMISGLSFLIQNGLVSEETANQLVTLSGVCNNLKNGLSSVIVADDGNDVKTWDIVSEDMGAAILSNNVNYAQLDKYVAALGETTAMPEIKNPLVVSTVTIQYNMSMYDVTVKVVLEKTNSNNEVVAYDTVDTTITLAEGATSDAILDAVAASGIVDKALAGWSGVYFADKYTPSTSKLPDSLVADVDYVITYTPNNYNVTFKYDDKTVAYPYGAKIILEKNSEEGQVYDYYVNGTYIPEGSAYFINGDVTIDRETGKPYVDSDIYEAVSDCYFTAGDKATAILTSGSLVDGREIDVRYPDNENGTLLSLKGDTLTAVKYPSSYEGLDWVPYTYTVVSGSNKNTHNFDGKTEVTVTESSYDRVEVVYMLVLSNIPSNEVLETLKLPEVLADEAETQKAALDSLGNYLDSMGLLDRTKLGALNGVIDVTELNPDPAKNEELKAYFKSVVSNIINNCLEGNQLKIYNLLLNYADKNNGGLAYYYKNSSTVINEINTLSGYLSEMLADDEKVDALEALVGAAGYDEYTEKITDLEFAMSSVKNALKAPNAAIDTSSANLGKLVSALEMSGEIVAGDSDVLYIVSEAFSVNADNKSTVSVTVQVGNGKVIVVDSVTKGDSETLTDDEINAIVAAVETEIAKQNVSDKYYTSNYKAAELKKLLSGATMEELEALDLAYKWTPVEFTVSVNGAEQTITVEDLVIDLPASPTAAQRYEYVIGDETVVVREDGTYTFTTEQIDKLFVNGKYTVKLNVIDIELDSLTNMVNGLNASVGNGAIVFALVENGGKYSIVMKVNAADAGALTGAVSGTAMGLVNSGYSYIGLGGNSVLYMDASNTMKISLQAVVDAIMASGLGTDTILKVMNANGTINNMKINGTVISDTKLSTYGGEFVTTTIELGNGEEDAMSIPFYITLGSAPDALVQLRNLIAGQIGNYLSFECVNGKALLSVTVPDKAYEAYLAALLVTENADFSSVNNVDAKIAFSFIQDLLAPMIDKDVTLDTYLNTASKLGYDLSLGENKAMVEDLYNALRGYYTEAEFVYDSDSCSAEFNLPIKGVLNSYAADMADMLGMIVEYETGIDLTVGAKLTNIGTQYEALYIDVSANGITNKAGLTQNLDAMKFSGASVIVLLGDVKADLALNATTVINLNGHTLTGNITGSGNVTVVDSSLKGTGKIDGLCSANVTVMPTSDYYTLSEDSEGNIVLEINASAVANDEIPAIESLIIDIASDLIFNGYASNSLYVDGNKVYSITVEDIVDLYTASGKIDKAFEIITNTISSEDIGNIINKLIADLSDFEAIGNAIKNDDSVLEFNMVTTPWTIETSRVEDGDYLTVSIVSGAEKERTLKVVIGGEQKHKDAVADIMFELAKIVDLDASVSMSQNLVNNTINFNWSACGSLVIDLTDPDVAVVLSVIIADGIDASANAGLVAGIKDFYENGSLYELEKAFSALTTSQIITAVKNFNNNDSFVAMIERLGLDDTLMSDAIKLESTFDHVGKIASALVRRMDVTGGSRTIGSLLNREFSVENINRTLNVAVGGYSAVLNLNVSDVSLEIKMFGDKVPVKPEIELEGVEENEKVAGSKIDTENGLIVLDTHADGLTVDELVNMLKLSVIKADGYEITVSNSETLVVNGATVTVTAWNGDVETTATYTVIILGDTNANGRIESGDAAIICEYYIGKSELDSLAILAADVNANGRIESGDASTVSGKVVDWENYESLLGAN